ncbi:MAG: hypothetical protein LBJ89_02880 [Holosporales bacterium]|jgi:hypothetical protein|nr:hypothetical protein [Holosporales bacterium]
MKKVFVFIPLCAVFCAMGHSSDEEKLCDDVLGNEVPSVDVLQEIEASRKRLSRLFGVELVDLVKVPDFSEDDDIPADEECSLDQLYKESNAAKIQLFKLFAIRNAALDRFSSLQEERVYPLFLGSGAMAAQLRESYCVPLALSFRNYSEVSRLAKLEGTVSEYTKSTLIHIQVEMSGIFYEFCKRIDPCLIWHD